MAEGAWRCSQCGTVNEPVANACRTCGRWPSLFELEGSTLETPPPPVRERAPAEPVDVASAEPEPFEPDVLPEPELPPELEEADDGAGVDDDEQPQKSRWQVLARLIVPIGVVVYILVTALADR